MTEQQTAVWQLYRDGRNKPPAGPLSAAYRRGFAGLTSIYHPKSLVFAAWKAGRDARASQTDVPTLVNGVLDELKGKSVDHLRPRGR